MPNHITNIVTIKGDNADIEKCLLAVKREKNPQADKDNDDSTDRAFDFEKIIPMPSTLKITSGSNVDNAMLVLGENPKKLEEMLSWPWVIKEGITTKNGILESLKQRLTEKDFEEARTAIMNIQLYGTKDWYEWAIQNWGTKWNAYSISVGEILPEMNDTNTIVDYKCEVQFDTAWSTPVPVLIQLSKMFPTLSFEIKFADEDIGNNCGIYTLVNGQEISLWEPTGNEAVKFAKEIKGWDDEESEWQDCLDAIQFTPVGEFNEVKELIMKLISSLKDDPTNLAEFTTQLNDALEGNEEKEEKMKLIKQYIIEAELYEIVDKF